MDIHIDDIVTSMWSFIWMSTMDALGTASSLSKPSCLLSGQALPAAAVHRACRRLHPLSAAVPRASIVDIRMEAEMDMHMGVHTDIHSLTMK